MESRTALQSWEKAPGNTNSLTTPLDLCYNTNLTMRLNKSLFHNFLNLSQCINHVFTVRQSLLFIRKKYVWAEAMSSHVTIHSKKRFIIGMYLRLSTYFDYVRFSMTFYLKKLSEVFNTLVWFLSLLLS